MAVDTPTDGQIAAYQASSGEFEWVDDSSGSPGGTSGSIQYNDGAGGFAGSTKMLYDDTDAKITLSTGGNTLRERETYHGSLATVEKWAERVY
jgi:hypothetical protein